MYKFKCNMSSENNREDVSRATDNSLNLPESHLDKGDPI